MAGWLLPEIVKLWIKHPSDNNCYNHDDID